MSTLRRQMEIDMLLGDYAEDTRKIYLDAIAKFEDHFGHPGELSIINCQLGGLAGAQYSMITWMHCSGWLCTSS